MPVFSTGTPWDQGLGSLSQMLFPDPSKIAQAGYYGAQQRSERLKADQMERQQSMREAIMNTHPWGTGQAPHYAQPGPGYDPIQVPGFAPSSPGPSPMPQAAAPQQAAPQAPPTLAGTMTSAMPGAPPSISPDLPGAPSPIQSAKTLPPYQPGTATRLGQMFTQGGLEDRFTTGRPLPMSSPAPGSGAPPAPTNTGSDGSIPSNDPQSGMFHPGSILPPSGNKIMAAPAAPDGSQAPPLDLGGFVAKLEAAGITGQAATDRIAAFLDEARQANMISEPTYAKMLASMARGDVLSSGTTLAQQSAITGENRFEFLGQTIPIARDDGSIGATTRGRFLKDPDKYNVLPEGAAGPLAAANMGLVSVFAKNPDGSPNVTRTETVTRRQAMAEHRMEAPSSWTPADKGGSGDTEEAYQRQVMADKAIQDMYKAPPPTDRFDTTRQDPGGISPERMNELMDRANKEFLRDPQLYHDQKNFPRAVERVLGQMQNEHKLMTPQQAAAARKRGPLAGIERGIKGGEDPALISGTDYYANKPQMRFRVDVASAPQAGAKPGQAPQRAPGGAPQAQLQAPQQGQTAGVSAGGKPENTIIMSPQGTPLIVHGGVLKPLTPTEQFQFQAHQKQLAQRQAVAGQP